MARHVSTAAMFSTQNQPESTYIRPAQNSHSFIRQYIFCTLLVNYVMTTFQTKGVILY